MTMIYLLSYQQEQHQKGTQNKIGFFFKKKTRGNSFQSRGKRRKIASPPVARMDGQIEIFDQSRLFVTLICSAIVSKIKSSSVNGLFATKTMRQSEYKILHQ